MAIFIHFDVRVRFCLRRRRKQILFDVRVCAESANKFCLTYVPVKKKFFCLFILYSQTYFFYTPCSKERKSDNSQAKNPALGSLRDPRKKKCICRLRQISSQNPVKTNDNSLRQISSNSLLLNKKNRRGTVILSDSETISRDSAHDSACHVRVNSV